jgi:carbonic anhydrase
LANLDSRRRRQLTQGQEPFAIILGCSDSRVPAEIVFDQGLGDLFVIRVAGNIAAPSQVGSIEYAAELFGTRLVVVLGHRQCGAVVATFQQRREPSAALSENLQAIVDWVRPSVERVATGNAGRDIDELVDLAVRANVRACVHHLRHGSSTLERLIANKGLMVVGAEYSLATGEVEFFDEPA